MGGKTLGEEGTFPPKEGGDKGEATRRKEGAVYTLAHLMLIRGRHHGTSITCDGFPFLTQGASAPCVLSRPTESWSFSAKSLLAVQVEVLPGHDGSTESRAQHGHVAFRIERRQLHHPDINGVDKLHLPHAEINSVSVRVGCFFRQVLLSYSLSTAQTGQT